MGRDARRDLVSEGSINHCTWRAHDLAPVLESDEAKSKFLELLRRYKTRHGLSVVSYSLMGTHPHLTCSTKDGVAAFSAFWHDVNGAFSRWYNRRHGRRGQVIMDRLRSPVIQDDVHLLTVMRYIDANPVRAGLVASPKDWAWSSYRHYALGEPNDLVDAPASYLALGATPAARRIAYRNLFGIRYASQFLERHPAFTVGPFIGDATWVAARMADLAVARRRKRPPDEAPA